MTTSVLLSNPHRTSSSSVSSTLGPRPLHLLIDTNSASSSASPTIRTAGLPSAGPRRKSSISYNCGKTSTSRSRPRPRSLQISSRPPSFSPEKENGNNSLLRRSPTAVDRGPVTLAEKHADLLQFIAQKESKCLELRSQLATHEGELLQLKRKWEKIVTRGNAYGQSSMNISTSPTVSPLADAPAITPNPAILNNIQKGVQGAARLLAQGLELTTTASASTPPSTAPLVPATLHNHPRQLLERNVAKFTSKPKHTSTSSIATARLSQSSASSSSTAPTEWEDEPVSDKSLNKGTIGGATTDTKGNDLWALLDSNSTTDEVEGKTRAIIQRRNSRAEKMERSARPPFSAETNRRSSRQDVLDALVGPIWAESVGKKWDNTVAKSQKRASVLLSDVSHSFMAALSGPSGAVMTPEPRAYTPSPLSPTQPFATPSQKLGMPRQLLQAKKPPVVLSPSLTSSGSLLDDGLEGLMSQVMTPDLESPKAFVTTAVMSPTASVSSKMTRRTSMKSVPKKKVEEEWNW